MVSSDAHVYVLLVQVLLQTFMSNRFGTEAVRGCVTFVTGEDYSERQSICDKPDTHFTTIPSSLPIEVVKLTVNHQDITSLDESQLTHLLNLTHLNLDSNKISQIFSNTFRSLFYLKSLSLRFNQLSFSSHSFNPEVMNGFHVLETLNLMENPIATVPSGIFSPIGSHLHQLFLAGASDSFHLELDAFKGLQQLRLLDLSYCHLQTLPKSLTANLDEMQLTELYLFGNPWRCDCRLSWLKTWFLKHSFRLTFVKLLPTENQDDEMVNGLWRKSFSPEDPSQETGDDSLTGMLQPVCATPFTLFGRPLFTHPSESAQQASLRTSDFICSPKALSTPSEVNFPLGGNFTLVCEFFADPAGMVVWYRNSSRIQGHWPRISLRQTEGQQFQSQLSIADARYEDAGSYACYLDTGHGRVNTSFTVRITSALLNQSNSHRQALSLGWINSLDTPVIIKYTSVITVILIVLLVFIGITIYYFHRCRVCSKVKPNVSPGSSEGKEAKIGETIKKHPDDTSLPKLGSNLGLRSKQMNPHSSLIRKRDIVSAIQKEDGDLQRSHLCQTLKQSIDGIHILSTNGGSAENYVAFHLVPSDSLSAGNLQHPYNQHQQTASYPVQNYAILGTIHPGTNAILPEVNIPFPSTNMQPIAQAQTCCVGSATNRETYNASNEQTLSTETVYTNLVVSTDSNHLSKSAYPVSPALTALTKPTSSHLPLSPVSHFLPCPLHGNLYATLRPNNTANKNTTTSTNNNLHQSRDQISSHSMRSVLSRIPAGIGSLPIRKKLLHVDEQQQQQQQQQQPQPSSTQRSFSLPQNVAPPT